MIGKILYRPYFVISRPLPIDAISTPAISGSSCSPDAVALAPFTICRNSGRYVIDPNSARPMMKPITLVRANTLLRNSASGSTGSAARLSVSTNSAEQHRRRGPSAR